MRRSFAPALVAFACLVAPAAAVAAPGDIAVADEGAWLGTTGSIARVPAGGGAAALLAAGAPLRDPWAVTVEGDGSLLVADEGAEAVFRVSPAGAVTTVVGGKGLVDPVGIALGPEGVAYVSDRGREHVLQLDLAAGTLTPLAQIDDLAGIAVDKAGKIVAAAGHAIQRIDPGTGAVTTVASGPPLDHPHDLTVQQDGTLYVADDRRVVRVDPGSGAKQVLHAGAPFAYTSAIDVDAAGDLAVADRGGVGRVFRVDRDTGVPTLVATGSPLVEPTGIAVVGGAAVDASGGGNGDPDGPAAPPDPGDPGGPGNPGVPGNPGTPGGAGSSGTQVLPSAGGGGITVTLPDGRVITLPPGVTPGTSGIKGVDFKAPSFVGKPKLSAKRFRAARRGRSFISAFRVGTAIQWLLNEPARVTVRVQKHRHLSRVCLRRARSSRHRTGTRCRKWVTVKGRYSKTSLAGTSSVRFRGRLRGKTLRPGRYRFVIRARDGAGNQSRARRLQFRIVR